MELSDLILPIIITIFALFALTRVILRFKDKKISVAGLIIWSALWIIISSLAYLPELAGKITRSINVRRPIDAFASISIVILFYLVFKLYVMLEETNKDVSRIVEQLAIQSVKKANTSLSGTDKREKTHTKEN